MSSTSEKNLTRGNVDIQGPTSHVMLAVHAVFDDLRCEPNPNSPGNPFSATLTGTRRSDLGSAISSYVLTRAVDDAMERGMFPPGTDRCDAAGMQGLVVNICVPEILAAMPASLAARSLFQPTQLLQRTWWLVRPGLAELVLLDGLDELLRRAIDTHGNVGNIHVFAAIESAKGMARMVGTPVVHVGGASYKKVLSQCPVFSQTWRWEVDLFSLGSDEGASDDYTLERLDSLGLLDIALEAPSSQQNLETGNIPGGVVVDPCGNRFALVSVPELVAAVKSCGPGSFGLAMDIPERGEGSCRIALLSYEPAARRSGASLPQRIN